MKPNDLLAFSMYLVHRTLKQGKFRMAISFRFNDMADHEFAKRYYYSPFIRMVDEKEYNDNREWPPQESKNYFSAF
jgi:hypothetical protein